MDAQQTRGHRARQYVAKLTFQVGTNGNDVRVLGMLPLSAAQPHDLVEQTRVSVYEAHRERVRQIRRKPQVSLKSCGFRPNGRERLASG